jgi:hypothetical protein
MRSVTLTSGHASGEANKQSRTVKVSDANTGNVHMKYDSHRQDTHFVFMAVAFQNYGIFSSKFMCTLPSQLHFRKTRILEDVSTEREGKLYALLFCIRKNLGPNLETGYPDILRGFSYKLQENFGIVLQPRLRPPLPSPFHFIIQESSTIRRNTV